MVIRLIPRITAKKGDREVVLAEYRGSTEGLTDIKLVFIESRKGGVEL